MTAPAIPELISSRLVLRAHEESDLDDASAMWADPEVVRHTGGRPFTRQEVWNRVLRYLGHWSVRPFGYWAIRERTTDRFLGEIGLASWKRDTSMPDLPEAGWVLSPAAQGLGYATEAMELMLGWADASGLGSTCCIITAENTRSVRLAERFGYRSTSSVDDGLRVFVR